MSKENDPIGAEGLAPTCGPREEDTGAPLGPSEDPGCPQHPGKLPFPPAANQPRMENIRKINPRKLPQANPEFGTRMLSTHSSGASTRVLLPVSVEPPGRDWAGFRSKGKLPSVLREWTGASRLWNTQSPLKRSPRGCFTGPAPAVGGVLAGQDGVGGVQAQWAQARCSRPSVGRGPGPCTRPAAAILSCGALRGLGAEPHPELRSRGEPGSCAKHRGGRKG